MRRSGQECGEPGRTGARSEPSMSTRTIAIAALVIALILLALLVL